MVYLLLVAWIWSCWGNPTREKKIVESKLRERLSFEEENYFFICKSCQKANVKFNFDEAFELNFRCPDCGNALEAQDNSKIIEFLRSKIAMNQNFKISID